jgi:hypothetical protein
MLTRPRDQRPWDLREVHAVLERHAGETAPSFQEAVLPVWDEGTADGTGIPKSLGGATPAGSTGGVGSTIALTPSALQISKAGTPSGGGTVVLGDSPTIATSPRSSVPSSAPPSPLQEAPLATPPAPSQRSLLPLVAAIVVAVVAGVLLFLKLRG